VVAEARQDVQPLDAAVKCKADTVSLGSIVPMRLTFCAREWQLLKWRYNIIHVLEHQQDDDYIDESNDDLTDLMQDNW